ncbi:hypothetical protein CRUP_004605, partial [Coryphaenoides rupestris]
MDAGVSLRFTVDFTGTSGEEGGARPCCGCRPTGCASSMTRTKDLILDQTIEKVSFCAPDRNFERAFSYICRDGTTRRWICPLLHGHQDSSGGGSSSSPGASPPLTTTGGSGVLGPQAIPRRHAPADALARQGSFRGFPGLSQSSSPFKRQVSLRIGNELPAAQRRAEFPLKHTVVEVEGESDSISSLCSQITTAFSGGPVDPFSSAPMPKPTSSSPQSP